MAREVSRGGDEHEPPIRAFFRAAVGRSFARFGVHQEAPFAPDHEHEALVSEAVVTHLGEAPVEG
jgi:hypothetical protein